MQTHFLNIPAIYRLGTKWIGSLPLWMSYPLAETIATFSFSFYRPAVDNVVKNLGLAFPSADKATLERQTKKLFRNYGRYLVDYGRFTSLNKEGILENIVCFEGRENLDAALALKKGVILLTGHLGNWELGGIFFGRYGLKMNVITLPDPDREIDEVRRRYRELHNVSTITIGDSPFSILEMVRALERGEMVAMLIDRHREGLESLETDFFGRPSLFPRGPFMLARITGAPIITAFVVKDGTGYRGIIDRPLLVSDASEEPEALKCVVKTLERFIVKYSDQWYNFTPL